MSEDFEPLHELKAAVSRQRPYAGFFDWPERSVAERGIAASFIEAARDEAGFPLIGLRSRAPGEDPPDCEATDQRGALVALEGTELVDAAAIVNAQRTVSNSWARWDSVKLREALRARISSKDEKTLKGGPYTEYIVLIHTDEPGLTIETVEHAMRGFQFASTRQIGRAYLLLSYHPGKGYPFVRLI